MEKIDQKNIGKRTETVTLLLYRRVTFEDFASDINSQIAAEQLTFKS